MVRRLLPKQYQSGSTPFTATTFRSEMLMENEHAEQRYFAPGVLLAGTPSFEAGCCGFKSHPGFYSVFRPRTKKAKGPP